MVSIKDIERVERQQAKLENEVQMIKLQNAARNERDKHIDAALAGIREDVESFANHFRWAARTVVGAILLAFVGWVLQGGLTNASAGL